MPVVFLRLGSSPIIHFEAGRFMDRNSYRPSPIMLYSPHAGTISNGSFING